MSNITKVSLQLTDAAILLSAASQTLKIHRAKGALRGRGQESIDSSEGLETAIKDVTAAIKEVLGQE